MTLHVRILTALAVAAILLLPTVSRASPPVLTVAQYSESLQRLLAAIDADRESGTSEDAATAVKAVLTCQVRMDSSPTLVYVDNHPLAADISDAESASDRSAQLRIIRRKVEYLRSELPAAGASPAAPNAVSQARSMLSEPQYDSQPIPPPSVLERWANDFQRWWAGVWAKLFHRPAPATPTVTFSPKLGRALLIVFCVVLVGFIVYYAVGLFRNRAAAPRRFTPSTSLAMDEVEEQLVAQRDYEKLIELAKERARSGDYRSAYRLVFVASLVRLDSEGVVRLNRSHTNWEYLADLRRHPNTSLYDIKRPMIEEFDRIWYGLRPAGRAEFDRALAQYEAVHRAALGGAPTGTVAVA